MMILESERRFQLWEYRVSHGSLMIRSPRIPDVDENIDVKFVGVEYLVVPRFFRGLRVELGDEHDARKVVSASGRNFDQSHVFKLTSQGVRYFIVALSCRVDRHSNDIFWSPFDMPGASAAGLPGSPAGREPEGSADGWLTSEADHT